MKYSWNICWLSFDRGLHWDFTQLDSTSLDILTSQVFFLPPELAVLEARVWKPNLNIDRDIYATSTSLSSLWIINWRSML